MNKQHDSVFWASFFEQKKTLQKLIEESHADGDFYLLLIVSSFLSTLGLILDSVLIVIGGMLVAPLLFPILSLAMGITTTNKDSIVRSGVTILKSVLVVFFVAVLTSLLFRQDISEEALLMGNMRPDLILFLASFAAGIAAAYTWVKQNLSSAMPGIAVTVALIPPLAAVGVGLTQGNIYIVSSAFTLFLINLLGITLSSLIIFSLFGFSWLQKEEEKLIQQETIEDLSHIQSKLFATKEKLESVTEKIEETKERVKSQDDTK